MKLISLILVSFIVFISVSASAEITVRPISLYFKVGGSPYKDLLVNNLGDKPAYVDIEAVQLINPGMPNETLRKEKNPKSFGLLVTPIRTKIPPRQGKSIRVSILESPGKVERDYRLWVRPLPSEVKAAGGKPTSPQVYLQVLTAYYIYIHVLPVNPDVNVSVNQTNNSIIVKNTGNVAVELRDGKQCVSPKKCDLLPKKTLYPNNVWKLAGKNDAPVTFHVYVGREEVAVVSG